MRRMLIGLVAGTLLSLGIATAPAQAAKPPWQGSYIQITKVTPDYLSARIRCPQDPDPGGTQFFSVGITNPDGTVAFYQLDVAALCDMARHQVTVPLVSGTAPVIGSRVDIYGSIAGDSGEVNVWYEDWKVQR